MRYAYSTTAFLSFKEKEFEILFKRREHTEKYVEAETGFLTHVNTHISDKTALEALTSEKDDNRHIPIARGSRNGVQQGLSAFKGVNSFFQFRVICKLASYFFHSCVQVIYEDVEEYRA
ncbi:hypothetical protein BTVI_59617 [Pitangus sulphuratus]|nr:hypothetical protein BTVI_59617 [Pitangus sulphuratus]